MPREGNLVPGNALTPLNRRARWSTQVSGSPRSTYNQVSKVGMPRRRLLILRETRSLAIIAILSELRTSECVGAELHARRK